MEHQGSAFGFREIALHIFGSNALVDRSAFEAKERMFQRDLEYMREKTGLGIDICWNGKLKGYEIVEDKTNGIAAKLFETLRFLILYKQKENFSKYIAFEKRVVQGGFLFNQILKATVGRDLTELNYHNYLHHRYDKLRFYPYYLKESKNRWYAVGVKQGDDEIFALGLDRISDFRIIVKQKRKVVDPAMVDKENYAACIGAYNRPELETEKVVFETNLFQAEYIKAYPMHKSQVYKDFDNKTVFELELKITPDFLMEILQYGNKIKVIGPEKLIKTFVDLHINATEVLQSQSDSHLIEEEFKVNLK